MGLRSLFLFLFVIAAVFVSVSATVTVHPSNNSQDLSWAQSTFRLQGSGPLNGQTLAPLTQSLARLSNSKLKTFHLAGNLTKVSLADSLDLNGSQIACIPCDSSDYPGPWGVDQAVENVVSAHTTPAAVLLYSLSAAHCNLTSDDPTENYSNVFTLLGLRVENSLGHILDSANHSINANMSIVTATSTNTSDPGGAGDSPNTAMIILYSITGIITALFLGIIITGAVRAHRHPERYGPRRVAGRPRQSRARGIARAMLDTIPIVKFGDGADGVTAAKSDVEMAGAEEVPAHEHSSPPSDSIAEVGQTTPRESELPTTGQHHAEQPAAPAAESKTDAVPDGGNFSCPICTDDFVKGQDLRVLPCNHQFHPECIDPWLVNVSGTCPLCRIDLNPPQAEQAEQTEQTEEGARERAEDAAEDGAASTADMTMNRHSRRLSNYLHGPLNARRMRHATVEERLAALRHVREASQGEAAASEDAARPNRSRLTTRLRDRFRIRTRAHGVEGSSPGESGTSTPTVPVPAPTHTATPAAPDST
ncbi:uncharacterized protein N7459_009241 [Penicillium hispanicum]|uniref:uncharacterized protein n=1 Tax=Penicillium hispanicum TaxID=1080232 RepID=UPI0025400BB3|nr:uncharacterized protein N7459_009241 [Penicillium hispanicum]KAJ5569811.1 hypothetical protein N7459_009241 [Penicillium hispanicum]